MKASYHTHTYRCRHAVGYEREYIEKAIAEGVKILGFADHAPMPYPSGYISTYKMRPEEIDEYFKTLLDLREEYKSDIEIKIGFETEYYPSLWEKCLDFWRPYPLEYLILGQHFVPEEYPQDRFYSGWATEDKTRITAYVDAIISGINTGIISYIAHPDLINYTGADRDFYLSEMRRLILGAKRLGLPLEYNLLGMSDGRAYPNPIFWEEAARLGASVIIGCDSHSPDRVASRGELSRAKEYLAGLGINALDEIELKKVLI